MKHGGGGVKLAREMLQYKLACFFSAIYRAAGKREGGIYDAAEGQHTVVVSSLLNA